MNNCVLSYDRCLKIKEKLDSDYYRKAPNFHQLYYIDGEIQPTIELLNIYSISNNLHNPEILQCVPSDSIVPAWNGLELLRVIPEVRVQRLAQTNELVTSSHVETTSWGRGIEPMTVYSVENNVTESLGELFLGVLTYSDLYCKHIRSLLIDSKHYKLV